MRSSRVYFLSWMVVTLLAGAPWARARENLVEIPIQNVFVPRLGFDDNDHVELVVRSALPNQCYTAGLNSLERVPTTRQLKVRHLAFREMNGPCAAPDEQLPVENLPFISPVSVGLLESGGFEVEFGGSHLRSFQIDKAPLDYIDNFRYSSVTAVETPEIFGPGKDAEVILSGLFVNSCERFDEAPQMKVLDDVIVILPIMAGYAPDAVCLRWVREYKQPVSLGKLNPGEYLVHARSRDGRAVYRLVNVSAE